MVTFTRTVFLAILIIVGLAVAFGVFHLLTFQPQQQQESQCPLGEVFIDPVCVPIEPMVIFSCPTGYSESLTTPICINNENPSDILGCSDAGVICVPRSAVTGITP